MVRFDFDAVFGDDYLHFYLPSLSDERNATEATVIRELLELEPGMEVLDAPCGHGRITNLLAENGCRMTGIDRTAVFLDVARSTAAERGVDVTYAEGDLRSLPWEAAFDAVVCWFTSFGYFDDDGNRDVLRQFRRALRPGGRVLIETLNRDNLMGRLTRAPYGVVERVGDDMLIDQNEFDVVAGRVETDRTTVRDGVTRRAHYSVRLPTVTEFTVWLHDAGFDEVRAVDHAGAPVTLDSRRLVMLARST